jgi:hypothetical protein
MAASAKGTEAECNHINIGTAETKSCMLVELHNPTRLNGADCIQQETDVSKVDMEYLILLLDV